MSKTNALLDLPTSTLLEKFGAGTHAPGSGSAAALMGLLSSKLIGTVAAITQTKPAYRANHSAASLIADAVNNKIAPRLHHLFERDAVVFDQVIKLRIARDKTSDTAERRRLSEQALAELQEATDIPLDISDECVALIDHGTALFDIGFKSARGDTGAAISAAVAGAMSGLFVANLNLKSFRGSKWAKERRERCESLHAALETKQALAFGRVTTLREEVIASMDLPFTDAE